MRIVRYIICFVLICGVVEASAQLKVYRVDQLEQLQSVEARPVLFFMYADWCVYCKQMRFTTFKNKKLVDILNRDFYFVSFNGEEKNPIVFKNKTYQYQPTGTGTGFHTLLFALGMDQQDIGYPSLSFFDSKLRIIDNAGGYMSAKALIRAAEHVLKKN